MKIVLLEEKFLSYAKRPARRAAGPAKQAAAENRFP